MKLAYYTREEVLALARRLRIGFAHPRRDLQVRTPATRSSGQQERLPRYPYRARPGAQNPDNLRRRAMS